jgi:FkbM family methyltransferase
MKSLIKRAVAAAGYKVTKNDPPPPNTETMSAALARLKNNGIRPDIVVDLGAAQGSWTEQALAIWPEAKYEMVEPLAEQTAALASVKKRHPAVDYHLAVAGEMPGEVELNVSPDLDGSGIYNNGRADNVRMVPVITIDDIVKESARSVVIKFDTHGYELPILNGAARTLKRTSALIIEVYGFCISPTCLLFPELCAHLDGLGFRLVDMVDIMRRPGDNAFWQCDAVFMRKEEALFGNNNYR